MTDSSIEIGSQLTMSNSPAKFVIPKRTCSLSWYLRARTTEVDQSAETCPSSGIVNEYIPAGSELSSPIATAKVCSPSLLTSHLIGFLPSGVTSTLLIMFVGLENCRTSARVVGRTHADTVALPGSPS